MDGWMLDGSRKEGRSGKEGQTDEQLDVRQGDSAAVIQTYFSYPFPRIPRGGERERRERDSRHLSETQTHI